MNNYMSVVINEKGETYKSKLVDGLSDDGNHSDSKQNNEYDNWFKPKIDKKKLKELSKRRSLPGIISIVLYFASLILTGYLAYYTWGTYWTILWFWIYGTIFAFSGSFEHECRHRTFFKQRWLNDVFQYILSYMTFRETVVMRWTHALHHSYTLSTKDPHDFEIQVDRPSKLFQFYMSLIPFGQLFWIHKSLFVQTLKCSLGFIPKAIIQTVPNKNIWLLKLNSRIQILFYISVFLLSIFYLSPLPVLYILLPYYYGNTLLFLTGYTQHAGLAFDVKDHRVNTRTVILNPILSWLYCKMDYHMEHHMFPMVPWYNLPKIHECIKDQLPKPNKGLIDAYIEILPAIHKQAIDPNYTPKRIVPI